MWSVGKKDEKDVELTPSDFQKIFVAERKIVKAAEKIDSLASDLSMKQKKSACCYPSVLKFNSKVCNIIDEKGKAKAPERNRINRRNAFVYMETSFKHKELPKDLHEKHSRALFELITMIPSIEYIKRLKNEIINIKREITKNQIINDIERYSEYWAIISDVDSKNIKENDKFLAKVQSSSDLLKKKYGRKAYTMIEYIIRKVIRRSELRTTIKINFEKILNSAITLVIERNKHLKDTKNALPHLIMALHEVFSKLYIESYKQFVGE